MGKIKVNDCRDRDDKFVNEIVSNRKKKKRIKELDKIKRRIFEEKKKLREKTARRKEESSTNFAKILNKFADRRQKNDNKTQGFDTKGKRTGRKKMCNRLLPLRKPQVGIFANGSKGAEIKRDPVLLNESDRARFEGDLQKVLRDGKRKTKESKSNGLKKIVRRRLSSESSETDNVESFENLEEKISVKNIQCCGNKNQSAIAKKMQMSNDFCEKMRKNSNSETEITKVAIRDGEIESVRKNCEEKSTWKRSLFQDEDDQFESCVCEPITMELRFSPRNDETKVKLKDPEKLQTPLDSLEPRSANQRYNFNYGQFGKIAATRYEKLCTMVCYDNFDNSLRELPHVDPLKSVKKFLTNFYVNSCRRKSSKKKFSNNELTLGVALAKEELNLRENCETINSLKENKNIHVEGCEFDVERLKRFGETINQYPKVMDKFTNRREETITKIHDDREKEKSMNIEMLKDFLIVKKSGNKISVKNQLPKDIQTSDSSSNYVTTNSLKVNNCESTKASLKSDVEEADIKFFGKVFKEKLSAPIFAGIPENRQKIMMRYLRDQLSVKNQKSILNPEITKLCSRSSSTEKSDFYESRCTEESLKRNYAVDEDNCKKRREDLKFYKAELNVAEKSYGKMNEKKFSTPITEGNKSRYLDIEVNNSEEEMRKKKFTSKRFFHEVDKKCEKHVPAILRKSRNVKMGKSLGTNFPELFLKRKARNSLGENLQVRKKQATENCEFFIHDSNSLKTKNKVRVRSVNLQPNVKKIEQNLIESNINRINNFRKNLTNCNMFEKSPSINCLENLAAQTISESPIFLKDEKISKDHPFYLIERENPESSSGLKIDNKNLAENFSPIVFKKIIDNDDSHSFLSTAYGEPNVIIIHENEICQDRRAIGNRVGENFLQPNYHHLVSANSEMRQIPFHSNVSRNGFGISQIDVGQRVYENFNEIVTTNDKKNQQNFQKRIVYKEKKPVYHFENNSGVYFEPRLLNVVNNSRGNFYPVTADSTNENHTQTWLSLPNSFRGNSNSDRNIETSSQLFDGRNVQSLILPRNVRVDPVTKFDEQILQHHRGDCARKIFSRDENSCCYKYIPESYGCSQNGYERSQIDGSGSNQRHQPVIQPAYNLTGAYRPQELSKNYFSNCP